MTYIDRTDQGYLAPGRVLPDGRVLDVMPLTFGRARLVVSVDTESLYVDDGW